MKSKLADQEQYYLAEIEVWKQAELNQMTYHYEHQQQQQQPQRFQGHIAQSSTVQTPSSAAYRPPLNIVSILKKPQTNNYQTANQFYQQQQDQRQQQQRQQLQKLQQQQQQKQQQQQLKQQKLQEQQQTDDNNQHSDGVNMDVYDQAPAVTKTTMKFPVATKKRKLFSHDTDPY